MKNSIIDKIDKAIKDNENNAIETLNRIKAIIASERKPDFAKIKDDEPTCDCYEVTKERHYLTEYEKGYYYGKHGEEIKYVTEEVPRCLGTKERETCTCGGYKSKCNFYRKKFTKELEDEEKHIKNL